VLIMPEQSVQQMESAEHAAMSVHIAVADFTIALQQARTVEDALAVHQLVSETSRALQAVESAALHRADALCGGK
jgi:hypothetical protein